MPHPPWATRAQIFIRCEHPAASLRLAETGETDQIMFLSTREQAGMVAGQLFCFFGLAFCIFGGMPPRLRVFSGLPTQGHRSLNFCVSALQAARGCK